MSMDELRIQSVFFSKLGFVYDPPRFSPDGGLIAFYDREKCVRYHQLMYGAGIRVHSTLLFSGWVGDGRYDYTETDRALESIFACGEELRYLPRIKLNVPLDWGKAHPEDMAVYDGGPRDAGEISALVDTPRHDILGYESDGYFVSDFKDDRVNRNGQIANQSFSSAQWRHDAGEALRRVIGRLEDGPYADRVAGYHIAYGICGETAMWGGYPGSPRCADYGIGNREAFFAWGLKTHGSLEALREAWREPRLTRGNFEIPSPDMREGATLCGDLFFRKRPEDRICIDYDRFMSEINADALEYFGSVAKESSGGKPVGAFYGYYMNLPRAAYNGHLAYDRILNSPHIDFIAAPAGYYKRGPGEPGGEQVCAQSINRKKLFLDELDNRTHLAIDQLGRARNMEETAAVLWREFSKNLMYGSNFWWMDLGGGWFDCPEIYAMIARMETVANRLRQDPVPSCAEVLLISDERAFFHSRANADLHTALLKESVAQLHRCGALIDHYRLSDLSELDLTRYKLVVFLNAFGLDAERCGDVRGRIPKHATLLILYAPDAIWEFAGVRTKEFAPSSDSVTLIPEGWLEGAPAQRVELREHRYPLFRLEETPGFETLVRAQDGAALAGETEHDGFRMLLCALPALGAPMFRRIMAHAGTTFRGPLDSTVYGNEAFLGVFGAANSSVVPACGAVETIIAQSGKNSACPFYVKVYGGKAIS